MEPKTLYFFLSGQPPFGFRAWIPDVGMDEPRPHPVQPPPPPLRACPQSSQTHTHGPHSPIHCRTRAQASPRDHLGHRRPLFHQVLPGIFLLSFSFSAKLRANM